MSILEVGVIGTSKKPHESRVPIHPNHLLRIPQEIRRQLVFENGYGKRFGVTDNEISRLSAGHTMTREKLLSDIGNVILVKPVLSDLEDLKIGGTLWGYPHCTQQKDITQTAIDRKLSLIAFEEMFTWSPQGNTSRHTFYKNNELAGYCAILHALQLKGIDGHYGDQRKVVILSFGAVSRGAIYALKARGFRDITICIQRPDHEVREEILNCHYVRLKNGVEGESRLIIIEYDGTKKPFSKLLKQADIIVNGSLQDPDNPYMFVTNEEITNLKPRSLIIGVSCDEGMGFPFARPTSFNEPILKIGNIDYYGVDHTPSYSWESASRSISAALIVYLENFLKGRKHWYNNKTINQALVVDQGIIQHHQIINFQSREAKYPHHVK